MRQTNFAITVTPTGKKLKSHWFKFTKIQLGLVYESEQRGQSGKYTCASLISTSTHSLTHRDCSHDSASVFSPRGQERLRGPSFINSGGKLHPSYQAIN